jgi:hypothetical protein
MYETIRHWLLPARPAVAVYAKYNSTSRGVQLLGHRKLFVLYRAPKSDVR